MKRGRKNLLSWGGVEGAGIRMDENGRLEGIIADVPEPFFLPPPRFCPKIEKVEGTRDFSRNTAEYNILIPASMEAEFNEWQIETFRKQEKEHQKAVNKVVQAFARCGVEVDPYSAARVFTIVEGIVPANAVGGDDKERGWFNPWTLFVSKTSDDDRRKVQVIVKGNKIMDEEIFGDFFKEF
jgi:hypothetical protein